MKIVKAGYEIIAPQDQTGFVIAAKRIERMGRIAYKSEDRITEDSWRQFVSMIVKRGHEAVLEHANMAVIFTCDRGVSHEIVRHRLCAFTQESTRYCNYSSDKFGNEITVIAPVFFDIYNDGLCCPQMWDKWERGCLSAEDAYFNLLSNGASPQQARSVLPNSLKTEIGVTANFREWRHIFKLRAISKAAHPQMREVMVPLYEHCRKMLSEVFDMGEIE
jgi:thymidylate synthase (FAD)